MVSDYVNVTGDTSILQRALPLAEVGSLLCGICADSEYSIRLSSLGGQLIGLFQLQVHTPNRRTCYRTMQSLTLPLVPNPISKVSCYSNPDHAFFSRCRYLDYLTVHDPTLSTPLTDTQAADLYSELASGAETGWDYSSRFEAIPQLGNPGLRSLNVKNHIPVCLNSILCM
jgi:alpha,alpha-trehalase